MAEAKQKLVTGTGRRKTAVARVFLYEGKGKFEINEKSLKDYFPNESDQITWQKPFHAVGVSHPEASYNATIKVYGSGKSAQLGAVVHGVSHALAKLNEEFSLALHRQGFLTRDSRMVERKKPFLKKARKRPQYSKR